MTGVSFASASSGYDTLTAIISVSLFLKHTSTLNKLEEVLEINKTFGNKPLLLVVDISKENGSSTVPDQKKRSLILYFVYL